MLYQNYGSALLAVHSQHFVILNVTCVRVEGNIDSTSSTCNMVNQRPEVFGQLSCVRSCRVKLHTDIVSN
jgi:hypothetical protein